MVIIMSPIYSFGYYVPDFFLKIIMSATFIFDYCMPLVNLLRCSPETMLPCYSVSRLLCYSVTLLLCYLLTLLPGYFVTLLHCYSDTFLAVTFLHLILVFLSPTANIFIQTLIFWR